MNLTNVDVRGDDLSQIDFELVVLGNGQIQILTQNAGDLVNVWRGSIEELRDLAAEGVIISLLVFLICRLLPVPVQLLNDRAKVKIDLDLVLVLG